MALKWTTDRITNTRSQWLACDLHPFARVAVTRLAGYPALGEPEWVIHLMCEKCFDVGGPDLVSVRPDEVPVVETDAL